MDSWYVLALSALVFFGLERFLYKVSAARECNTAWTTFSFMTTVALTSSVLFFLFKPEIVDMRYLFVVAAVNSASFTLGTIMQIEALKYIPTNIAYPIIRFNTVIVVLFSVFYFKDRLSLFQATGIILSIVVLVWMTRQSYEGQSSPRFVRKGLYFAGIALLSGAVAAISSKFAAVSTNMLAFIALSYIMGSLFSLTFKGKMHKSAKGSNQRDALIIGCCMGFVNLAGFYAFLKALSLGPLSIIISIVGMHFIVAIILAALIYKERITGGRIAGIILTIIALILMRF